MVFEIVPLSLCTGKPGAAVVRAVGLGYGPNLCIVWLLWAAICRLAFLPTDIAQCVTSNASSQTSSRWRMQCDVTTYVICWEPISVAFSIKGVATQLWVILLWSFCLSGYGQHWYTSGPVRLTAKLPTGPARYLSVLINYPCVLVIFCITVTVLVYFPRTALPRTGLLESAPLSLVYLHIELLHRNICKYVRARSTTYQWSRSSPPYYKWYSVDNW